MHSKGERGGGNWSGCSMTIRDETSFQSESMKGCGFQKKEKEGRAVQP